MAYTNENNEEQQQQPEQDMSAQKASRKKKRGNQHAQEQEEQPTEEDEQPEVEGGQDYEGAEDEEIEGEESEGGYEEEDEEEEGEGRKGQKRPTQVGAFAKKVVKYVDEQTQNMDTKTLAKYAAVGVLLFAGMRKSGFLGSLAVSVAAGIITKHIAENASEFLGDDIPGAAGSHEEEEEGAEAATATA